MNYIILIGYLLLIFLIYKSNKTINIPLIFNSVWFFIAFLSTLFSMDVSVKAYLYVLICNASLDIGYLVIKNTSYITSIDLLELIDKYKLLNNITIFLSIAGIIYLFIYLKFTITNFTSLSSLASKMASIASMRYNTDEMLPIINRLINSVGYFMCALDGFFYMKIENKKKGLYILFLFFIQMILLNTKATLVFALAFWFAGLITGYQYFGKKIELKKIIQLILILTILLILFVFVNYLRHNMANSLNLEAKKIFVAYFVGPYTAFSKWITVTRKFDFSFGLYTFSGFFDLIGIYEREIVKEIFIDNISTNVYTVFRYILKDYGYFFSVLLFFIIGFISKYIQNIMKIKRGWISIYIIILVFLITSFFTSIFKYNVNLLACFLIILFFLPIRFKFKNN